MAGGLAFYSYVEDANNELDFFGLSSYALRKNMLKANKKLSGLFGATRRGWHKVKGSAAHHIVAENDHRASGSRAILASVGIDVDNARNGIFLKHISSNSTQPGAYHRVIHTDAYHRNIENRLQNVINNGGGRKEISNELDSIHQDLLNNTTIW